MAAIAPDKQKSGSDMKRYSNKRVLRRKGGRFARTTAADLGIGSACETCGTLTVRVYTGDPADPTIDHRRFQWRCFTCQPLTETERTQQEPAKPKLTMADFFDACVRKIESDPK